MRIRNESSKFGEMLKFYMLAIIIITSFLINLGIKEDFSNIKYHSEISYNSYEIEVNTESDTRSYEGLSIAVIGQAQSGWLESELVSRLSGKGASVTFVPVTESLIIDLYLYDITIVTAPSISSRVKTLENSGAKLLFLWSAVSDLSVEGLESFQFSNLTNITVLSSYGPFAGYPAGFNIYSGNSAYNFAFSSSGNLTKIANFENGSGAAAFLTNDTTGSKIGALGYLPRSESAWKTVYKSISWLGEIATSYETQKSIVLVTNSTTIGISYIGEEEIFDAIRSRLGNVVSKLDVSNVMLADYSSSRVVVANFYLESAESFWLANNLSIVYIDKGTKELANSSGSWSYIQEYDFTVENSSKSTPLYGYLKGAKIHLRRAIKHDITGFSNILKANESSVLSMYEIGKGFKILLGIIPYELCESGIFLLERCIKFCIGIDFVNQFNPNGIVQIVDSSNVLNLNEINLGMILSSAAQKANVNYSLVNYSECSVNIENASLVVFSNSSHIGSSVKEISERNSVFLVGEGVGCLSNLGLVVQHTQNMKIHVENNSIYSPAYGFARNASISGYHGDIYAIESLPQNFTSVACTDFEYKSVVVSRNNSNGKKLVAVGFYTQFAELKRSTAYQLTEKCALWALNFSISEIEVDCIAFVVEDSKNLTEDEKAITTYLNTHEIEYNIIDASCFGAVEYSPSQRFIVCSQGLIGNMPIDRRDAGYLLLGDALYDISTALGFHAFNINSTWNINESLEAYQLIDYPSLNSLNLPKPFILFTNLTNVSSIRNAMEDLDQNFLNIICPYDKEPLYEKSILAMYELQEGMQLCAYSFKPSYENDFDSLSWKIFNRMIWSIVESNTHPGIENINITRCGNSINFSALVYERCGIVETVKLHWAWSNSLSAWNTVSMTYIGNDIYFYLFTDMNSSIHYYLEAFGMDGKVEKTEIFEVNPNYVGNIPPVPVINYTFMSYFKDYRVDFNCSASYDPDGNITAYYINFGDGYSTGWQESYKSTHSYVKSGYYVVTLSVRDNVGAISEIRITIFVGSGDGNTRPNAYFTYYPSQPREYEEITFDASASYDADGDIIYYFWDFDDGITGDGVIERHTFTKAGFYHVSLMVSDGKSSSSWYVNLHIYSRGEDELPDTSIYQAIGVLLLIIVIVFAVIFVVYMLSKKKKIYPSFVSSYAPIRQCPKCMQTLYYSLSLGVYYCYYCRKHYHEKQLISINESNPQTTQTQPKIEEEQKTKHVETSNMKEVQKVAKQVQKETRDDTYDTKISISTSAKCPKCKTIIKIESNERPIALQCPNCGTKGTLK